MLRVDARTNVTLVRLDVRMCELVTIEVLYATVRSGYVLEKPPSASSTQCAVLGTHAAWEVAS